MRAVALVAMLALAGCAAADPYLKQVKPLVRGDEPVITGTLAGGPWLVEDVNGGGVIDNARLALDFADGRVSGMSGCNRFTGSFRQQGGTVGFGPLAGTRMACAPALMMLEGKFLATLAAATVVVFDKTGAALLKAPDGRLVKIRRQ